jgi:hypothetical protein
MTTHARLLALAVTTGCTIGPDGGGEATGSSDDGSSTASTTTTTATTATATTTIGSSESGDGSADVTSGGSSSDSGTTGDVGPETEDFDAGTLVIPMDTDHQDMGMLRAYGLVHALLREGIAVRWAILAGKQHGDVDFEATTIDVASGVDVGTHGYRGGPWIIAAPEADAALSVVAAWQAEYPETTVHEATVAFTAPIARRLDWAPTIAIFEDANEDIARGYLQAAGIPDSTGNLSWPADSPDVLSVEEVAGPSDIDHADGALFGAERAPRYCQFMSMHWDIAAAEANPEVIAELDEYLTHNTHFFAECQAVSAFENMGHFLTPNGFEFADQPTEYELSRSDSPFGQLDGPFESVGGSEPAYSLPPGDAYFVTDTVIIGTAGAPEGQGDVWMTGFRHGACAPDEHECPGSGKVSYLGGHQYDVALPISENPTTQGARLFLNSLFEAPCALE